VCDSNDQNVFTIKSVDNAKWKSPHEEISMSLITQRKSFGIGGDLRQSVIEFSIEIGRRLKTPFGVPTQRLGVISLGRGANNDVSHQDQRCDVLVRGRRTTTNQSFRPIRTNRFGD